MKNRNSDYIQSTEIITFRMNQTYLTMKNLLLLIVAIFATLYSQAQYTFSTFIDSYGIHLDATEIEVNDYDDVSIWDDPDFVIELDFPFPVNDQEYSSIVQIGGGATLMLTNGMSNSIFSYNSDLIDAELETPSSYSVISYITVGEIGSRILKVQYENCGFYNSIAGVVAGDVTNRINFQMWFYETGVFEMRFGPNSISNTILVHGGLGPLIFLAAEVDLNLEDAEFQVALSGDPSNPTLVFEPLTNGNSPSLDGDPGNGRVYRFEPTATAVDERSVQQLKLYPTQADQLIYIKGLEDLNAIYQITDITGKVQANSQLSQGESIDVSALHSGLYLIQIEGYAGALKFVKLK